jgi:hypothetical protein
MIYFHVHLYHAAYHIEILRKAAKVVLCYKQITVLVTHFEHEKMDYLLFRARAHTGIDTTSSDVYLH